MPEIRPFRGILYNLKKINVDNVVAPPYDVITPQQQEVLYNRSPYNIVRLILGQGEDWYRSAAKYLDQWKAEHIVVPDSEPALYVLSQEFTLPEGKRVERYGFIAACKLEDFGKGSVFPHEKTLSGPKEDRFRLFQATGTMFSQIFSLYEDSDLLLDRYLRQTMDDLPMFDTVFEDVRNRLWKMTDSSAIGAISSYLLNHRVFVADGHHRYETALLYRDSLRLKYPNFSGTEPFNYVPMFFTNMSDPGLVIYPTHRLVHSITGFDQSRLLSDLQPYFTLNVFNTQEGMLASLKQQAGRSFGLVLKKEPPYAVLQLKDDSMFQGAGIPPVLAQLDATILHTGIFRNILHMSEEDQVKKRYLDYEKDEGRAIVAVRDGKAQAAFLMNPTRMNQIRAVAEAGFTMPQKSTYFYPKLLSGLVTYSFFEA
ncbi:MAG: DUF1015 domain-containing protein [Ignavibacteria bacterium]|nr:DUF1015 domain-containing protein [Ignavibacteria bacterium]MBI3765497.1 DUF1015 domain-containing protein [Ignavibacteriales bacterium]